MNAQTYTSKTITRHVRNHPKSVVFFDMLPQAYVKGSLTATLSKEGTALTADLGFHGMGLCFIKLDTGPKKRAFGTDVLAEGGRADLLNINDRLKEHEQVLRALLRGAVRTRTNPFDAYAPVEVLAGYEFASRVAEIRLESPDAKMQVCAWNGKTVYFMETGKGWRSTEAVAYIP